MLKVFGGALLISGTAIGAGMLALPVATAGAGLLPSYAIYLLCWLFGTCTGLLLTEACLWMPEGSNFISTAHRLLGRTGAIIAWILYIFLFYCLMVAYVTAGAKTIESVSGGGLSHTSCLLLFTLFFGAIVCMGTRSVNRINALIMAGLCISYLCFLGACAPGVRLKRLSGSSWPDAVMALPVIFTSFGYQGIMPSLTTYFKHNAKMLRTAVLIGTSIPFVVYAVWQLFVLGVIPTEGPHGLIAIRKAGEVAVVESLRHLFPGSAIYAMAALFRACAVVSSFLGVALSLIDFLSDGLHLPYGGWRACLIASLVFLPPLLISGYDPGIFFKALTLGGGIGCVLLLGLLPVLMVWQGRYRKGYGTGRKLVPGGRGVLTLLILFVIFEVTVTIRTLL
ncbi:MAG: tyrosine transporter [Simkaniaceae bacterium]|nr:tyrosine transporter [Simkaniaceae bacterium]